MRTESQPIGRLIEQFIAIAFQAHPYHQPVVGYMSDLQSITITDAEAFFEKYYVPSNLVTVVVGDVKTDDVISIVDEYFSRIPRGPEPQPLRTVEPEQIAEKTVILEDPSQPIYLEGYHKPSRTHPDQAAYDAIDDILSRGRTCRLYRKLVRDEKIAVQVGSFAGFPGDKYPNLHLMFAIPSRGVTNEEVQVVIREEIERLKNEDVTDDELQRFKTRAKADLIRSLRSNQGLANSLADYQAVYGDWRELFRYIEKLDAVTKEDIRRVATETYKDKNRTVGMLVTETAESGDEDAAAGQAGS